MADALALPPALLRRYRIGLLCHTALIVSIAAGAYAGVLPTKIALLPFYDLVMHFVLVGMFGFFLDGALAHRSLVALPFVPRLGPSVALVIAAAEEYAQRLSPRRSSSWSDFFANAAGILVCAWLAKRITTARIAREAGARAEGPTAHSVHPDGSAGEGAA